LNASTSTDLPAAAGSKDMYAGIHTVQTPNLQAESQQA
jgi:hypothetical protein